MTIAELKKERRRQAEANPENAHRVYEAISRVEWKLENLESAARSLSERLARVAQDLRERGTKASFNSLGEVQGMGSEVDRLCGELRMAIDIAAEYLPKEK